MGRVYSFCMVLGQLSGCHQRPERSFSLHGRQFPICARCTGVLLGELIGLISYRWFHPPLWVILAFCSVMLLDWGIQALGWLDSTNFRRLITGTLCGYAYLCGFLMILKQFIRLIF